MTDNKRNPYELLRMAISAQIDLGTTELILPVHTGKRSLSGKSAQTGQPAQSDKIATLGQSSAASFDSSSDALPGIISDHRQSAQFESVASHYKAICNCQKCPLGATRNKFVYGVGNVNADIMFIGEAPGANEDAQGEPFVGRSGELLDKILAAISLSRQEVYIANILKCRPPDNRDPQPEEMNLCFGYLEEQIRLIRPKLICALGRIAAQALLRTTTPLGKLRNQWHDLMGTPTIVTYHPAALLRFASYKRDTWEDMKALRAKYDSMK